MNIDSDYEKDESEKKHVAKSNEMNIEENTQDNDTFLSVLTDSDRFYQSDRASDKMSETRSPEHGESFKTASRATHESLASASVQPLDLALSAFEHKLLSPACTLGLTIP